MNLGVSLLGALRRLLRRAWIAFRRRRAPHLPPWAYEVTALGDGLRAKRLRLLEKARVGGRLLRAGSELELDPWNGRIREGIFDEEVERDGLAFAAGLPVRRPRHAHE